MSNDPVATGDPPARTGEPTAAAAKRACVAARALRKRATLLALVALLSALWFGTLEVRGLFWPDEGRYAAIAREMLASGDFVTPRLNGLKYFEKPPLQYWASAIAFRIFQPDEWTARLWPATTGFALVIVSAIAWWRWKGAATGLIAGAVLAGASGIVLGGQILTLDMGLTFFLSIALLALIAANKPGVTAGRREWMMVVVWAAVGLAVLCKGLIGIVLPALTLVAYAAVERDPSVLRRALTWRGIAALLVLTLPWFVLVQRANPEFWDLFFVQEHFRRFSLPNHNRPGPWWYFVPIAAAALLPWTVSLPAALRDAWRAPRREALHVERLLVIWTVVVIAFFSVSHSKLPAYILPALPACAWLLALARPLRGAPLIRNATLTSVGAGAVMIALSIQLDRFEKLRELGEGLAAYPPYLVAAGVLLLLGGALVWALRHRAAFAAQVVVLAAANLASLQVVLAGMHEFDAYYSAEQAIESVAGETLTFPPDPPFYSVDMLDQSVPFYLGRTVTLVAHRGELADGIAAEPHKFIELRTTFEQQWRAASEAYAVMSPATYRELAASGLPMTVMASDPRRVFVARGAWPREAAAGDAH